MHRITASDLAKGTAVRWAEQYGIDLSCFNEDDSSADKIAQQLVDLGDAPTPEKIAGVIGNNSWTNLCCHECGAENVDEVWQVGEPFDYESQTADLCGDCVSKLVMSWANKEQDDFSDATLERLARVLCEVQGTDPDTVCWGLGAIMPVGWDGPAWEVRIPYVRALLADMQGAGMLKSAPPINPDVRDFEGAGV